MNGVIRVIVVDDHALVRRLLAQRLDREPGIHVVGECDSADAGLELALATRPEVVLMDVDMPGRSCFDVARTIRVRVPETRVVFVSAYTHDRYLDEAMAAQAWGYISKTDPEEAVIDAVRQVAGGVARFSEAVQRRMVVDAGGVRVVGKRCSRAGSLSSRELEVLRYLSRGASSKSIAADMHLSVNTVNRHIGSIMDKTGLHNRVELTRFAIREGLSAV